MAAPKDVPERLSTWLDRVGAGRALEVLAGLYPDAAVFAVDGERRILAWSAGAEKLLGYSAIDVVGENCLKANRCQRCMAGCGIAEHRRVRNVPLTLFSAGGRRVRVRKTAQAFFDDSGNFAGGIEVLVPDDGQRVQSLHPPRDTEMFHGMLTGDPIMRQVFSTCRNVAQTDTTVLLHGESGTGKELIARALHMESARRERPFVAVNCAALTSTLIESELFGHVKGAFTGAIQARPGIFREASGGTLLLDEVAELPLGVQAKLLRVLEEREVVPVGGDRPSPVDVRLIAATHRSLPDEVETGRFREDLLFRLRVVPLNLPPLRKRQGDLELLLWHMIGERNQQGQRIVDRVAPEAMRALLGHRFTGNVRELKNIVDYAFAVGRGPELLLEELPPEFQDLAAPSPGRPDSERNRIQRALERADGNLAEAARALGISRATLWRKRKRLKL